MIVMGSIVGSGVFYAPSAIARQTGSLSGILAVWALGGVFAITGAFVFAELGAMFPRAGGQYVFLRETYGRFTAFLFGWILLTAIVSPAVAFVAGVFVDHGEALARSFAPEFALGAGGRQAVAMGLIVGLALANVCGVRLGATVQNAAMSAKIVGILTIVALAVAVGAGWLEPRAAAVTQPVAAPLDASVRGGIAGFGAALLGVVFSYGGWQNVTAVASEIREPRRVLPLGIVIGTVGVIALYLTLNASLVFLLGVDGLAATTTPVAAAAGRVLAFGEPLVAGLVMLSTFAVCQLLLMLAPRIFYAMALDGVFFERAGRVHPGFRTPAVAIGVLAAASLAHVALAAELQEHLEITTLADSVFFALCGLALFVLRRRRPELPRPYRALGYPWLPAVFMLFASGMVADGILHAKPAGVELVGVLFIAGTVLYCLWSPRARDFAG